MWIRISNAGNTTSLFARIAAGAADLTYIATSDPPARLLSRTRAEIPEVKTGRNNRAARCPGCLLNREAGSREAVRILAAFDGRACKTMNIMYNR